MVFLKSIVLIITLNALVFKVQSDGDISSQKFDQINEDISNLENSIAGGLNVHNINKRIEYIDKELWNLRVYTHTQPKEDNALWNESELLILDAKKRLDSLSDKFKLEGDWGKISLRYNPLSQIKPNIKYLYPF